MGRKRNVLVLISVSLLMIQVLAVGWNQVHVEAAEVDSLISSPRVCEGESTWDCIYFGNYWQNDTNGDGVADDQDAKTPIKWRVLSVDETDAFIMADYALDLQKNSEDYKREIWSTCYLRNWLNGTFMDNAFNQDEKDSIITTSVDNGTDDIQTNDNVYILSVDEASDKAYGFDTSFAEASETRVAYASAFCALKNYKADNKYTLELAETTGSVYWLRTPGDMYHGISHVNSTGEGFYGGYGNLLPVVCSVRPVLHIDLTSSEWSYAGTVSAKNNIKEDSDEGEHSTDDSLNIDENLQLNISVVDSNLVFDWNVEETAVNYQLQYNIVDAGPFGLSYSTGTDSDSGIVPHFEEPLSIYNDCWPVYFRLRMVKKDGTIWYSQSIEYYPPSYKVTFMDGETVVSTQEVYIGESATAPQIAKEGYVLLWDGVYTNVQADVTIKAVWTAKPEEPEEEKKDDEKSDDEKSEVNQTDEEQQMTENITSENVSEEKLPTVGIKKILSGGQYKVTKSSETSKEVLFVKMQNSKKTSVVIPATVKIDGYTYKVTEISSKAFKNNKKLKSVTIGKNVKKIGKEAFYNCKKLKKITIKSTVLKSVGKNAIKNIDKKATIKVPKKQLSKYKKLFKSKTGYKKTMKVKK